MSTALTDLEVRLAAPGGAAARDELLARMSALEQQYRTRIAQGLPRDEFPLWQAAAASAAAAREVLATWPAVNESALAASAAPSFIPPPS